VLADNFMTDGGPAHDNLNTIAQNYPITFHCVGLSLGSSSELDLAYLNKLKSLADRYQPVYISDHLCWTSINGKHLNDLLPLPCTEEAAEQVIRHIQTTQEHLGRRIFIENPSSYLTYTHSVMPEWDFINYICQKADCDILLDVNNIYVSSHNHQFNPEDYLQAIDKDRVRQFHLAGFTDYTTHLLDSHGEPVHEPVWQLYRSALKRFGAVPTLIEWDSNIPEFAVLMNEAITAERAMEEICN